MMHLPAIVASATPPTGSALDDMLRLIGIAVIVFAVFKGIKLLITKPAVATEAIKPAPAPAAVPPPAAAVPAPAEGIAPEIIAAIAAAVAAVTGRTHRIIAIKPMSTSWERAGRQSVLTSHRIR